MNFSAPIEPVVGCGPRAEPIETAETAETAETTYRGG
jgi:hypothetical protein